MLNKNFKAIHSAVPVTCYDNGKRSSALYLPGDSSTSTMNITRTIVNPQNRRIVGFYTTEEDKICCNGVTTNVWNYFSAGAFSLVPETNTSYYIYSSWSMASVFVTNDGARTFCSDQPEEITTTDAILTYDNSAPPYASCPFIILGAGTTPATADDYRLENCNLNYKVVTCTSSFDPKNAISTTNLTIQANEDGDVSEIGLYTACAARGSSYDSSTVALSSTVARICMVGRKVLDTPIHIQAGKVYTFSYTIDFMLMSDSQ